MSRRSSKWLSAVMALMAAACFAAEPNGDTQWSGKAWGGIGYWYGDVTYQIGGEVTYDPGITEQMPDKISELKWPIEAPIVVIGADAMFRQNLELRGTFSTLLLEGGGTMEDSDWYYFTMSGEKEVYSESDASLKAWSADIVARYWFMNPCQRRFAIAVGGGALRQDLRWEANNLDQWYPQNPELGHDTQDGLVGTFEAVVNLPYAEVAALWRMSRIVLHGAVDIGYALVSDKDEHLVRYISSETDADGVGLRARLGGLYTISKRFFLQGQITGLVMSAKGTQASHIYAGKEAGTAWEIDHKVSSVQTCLELSGVYQF